MSRSIVVFEGTVWEAVHMEAHLVESGIPAFSHDPIEAGTMTSGVRQVWVAPENAEAARSLVRTEQDRIRRNRPEAPEDADIDVRFLRRLTKPMPWYAVSIFLAPLGVTTGVIYLVQSRRLGKKAPQHGEILAWWVACVLLSMTALAILAVQRTR